MGHLCHWVDIERVFSRDLWYLTSCLARKILAHTIMIWLNHQQGHPWLQFSQYYYSVIPPLD